MMSSVEQRVLQIALVGNPNTGKSTLFNALCGLRQRVGNYPGVTVEKKVGRCDIEGVAFHIVDLPGSYSLAPRSPDEMIAVEVLLGLRTDVPRPDAVLCIVDASNLERNLYLVSQVLELNLPTVVALNMTDVAENRGVAIDVPGLRQRLGVPVVEIQAHRKLGIDVLRRTLAEIAAVPTGNRSSPFPPEFQDEVARLEKAAPSFDGQKLPRYLVERLLLDTSGFLASSGLPGVSPSLLDEVTAARERLRGAGHPVPAVEALARYRWVGEVTEGLLRHTPPGGTSLTDRLDRVLTHRAAGTAVFLAVMLAMFASVFHLGGIASSWIDAANGMLSDFVMRHVAEGPLQSLLVNGIVAGVGGVLMFLPQIFVLFFFIAVLEDCGYMARAAYLMDKLMSRVGLSGKSFIPLLSSFACAIPGIMSARVIENSRDRLVTILIAPLMSCSARSPVYVLLIVAFIPQWQIVPWLPGLQSLVMLAMYLIGILAAVGVALVLRRTLFRGPTPPFVMELPTYKFPSPGLVLHRMLESGWSFVRRAGTLILAVSLLVWWAAYYPRDPATISPQLRDRQLQLQQLLAETPAEVAAANSAGSEVPAAESPTPESPAPESEAAESAADQRAAWEAELTEVDNQIKGEYLRHSYLGRMGRFIEPAVRPLGWDWRIGSAVIASFPAREVVVATLGVIYNLGEDQDEESPALWDTLRNATWEGTERRVFSIPVALSLMVFFALCAQCVSTLVIIRRETNSWRWPLFTFVYMTTLAYLAALVVYQVGSWFKG